MGIIRLTFGSDLSAEPAEVWGWATSAAGIAAELHPIFRMTMPPDVANITNLRVELGSPLFTSWVYLFGVLPIDRVRLTLVELDEGRGFVEQSPMLSMKLWRHERRVAPSSRGTTLTDTITCEPRFPGPLAAWFFRRVFEHRHDVLRRQFDGVPVTPAVRVPNRRAGSLAASRGRGAGAGRRVR